jgi:branched-chain amino acid transport system substrate-binding protein
MSIRTPLPRRNAIGLLSLGLLSPTLLLQGCDNIPSIIKVGVAQPLTGPLASWGKDMLNGVTLAVEDINKDGFRVKGKPVTIEIVAVDDQSNPEIGKKVAQQLVDAGVVAVIGHLNSGVSMAAAPIYAEKHIAEFAISTHPRYTEQGFDTTFRLVANDNLQAKAIGSFSVSRFKASNYAVLDDGTPYGKDLAAGATVELKKAKKEIVLQQSFDGKTTQFDETAAKIKAARVEVIVTTLSDFQVVALIDALKSVDYTDVYMLGADGLKTPLTLKKTGVLKGLYAASPILEIKDLGATGAKFLNKYRAKFNTMPVYGSHYSYDAMYILSEAIRSAQSADPQKIVEAVRRIDRYVPVTGSMSWDAKGEQRYCVIGVYSANGDTWDQLACSNVW